MWTGAYRSSLRWFRRCVPCLKSWRSFGATACGIALLVTVPGCSWTNSTPAQTPAPPVLQSLQRATLNGEPGVWMNDADAGNLALWLYEVAP